VDFTFFWPTARTWEVNDFAVAVVAQDSVARADGRSEK
jgi:hypothetical protein